MSKKTFKIISIIFLLIGVLLIIIKGLSGSYIDEDGFLHEYFFLLPVGFSFIFLSIIAFIISKIKK